ncbi:JAB domain-containing protein [Chitinophaga silvisoli]|uniref:DNA repair protein n=1 Tax=Chitinophaga silvisoli TaxID=2291814 RepID=A0A3E1P2R0_9BACT|nr:JAB domain-containing protein [Chitinophaga silvisoli]RFM34457.1 DNA repair protein [Chitinophaga silvisoli]
METFAFISNFQVSEVQLTYKRNYDITTRPAINCQVTAVEIFRQCWDDNIIELQEQFKVMYLSNSNAVLAISEVSTGTCTSTVVDPRILFATSLKLNAIGLIIAHNHPSGILVPSQADIKMTTKLKEIALLLEIKLLDHFIFTKSNYYSFADEGLL